MSYNPQRDSLDFEIGAFGDRLKKGFKKASKAIDTVTDATITKPSAFIGKTIGGKKGEAIGRKLGGFTSKVTKVGVGAGVAGAALPLAGAALPLALSPAGMAVGGSLLGKKLKSKGRLRVGASISAKARGKMAGRKGGMSIHAGLDRLRRKSKPCKADNALAAKVAAVLVAKLGGPLNQANKALRLADLQRTATYEHKRLMSDADFRKKVIAGLTSMAAAGDVGCKRTIQVLVGRS